MVNLRMREKLESGGIAIDCWLTGTSPSNAEVIGRLGFDSVVIDMQHTMASFESVAHCILALSGTGTTVIVRVPGNDSSMIQRVLDAGADGIMCPLVNTVDEAKAFVDAVRYPPLGKRSVGAYRTSESIVDHFRRANKEIFSIVQIETIEALANAEDIAAVDGLDMLFPGPGDLAVSHGGDPILDFADEHMAAWHERIVEAAHAQGKWAGLLTFGEHDIARAIAWGYDLLCPAMEGGLLVGGATHTLRTTGELILSGAGQRARTAG
ncbi:HpcH/HpaI aldolase family protein [Microbacterium lacus]|uniref:Aldolase/citrate lyase family protein n=1 Tax=Microbacterium lacus TaxID=415217 RepID=A0ABN2H025_9MICO